ncbi:MAG: hypothetical protein PSX37_07205 [bacterium]|nr:hypothetical protein [bacterium]
MSRDRPAGSDAERTSLAWSRTLIAFAAVVGLIGVRAALVDAPLWVIVPILMVSVGLLLANGVVTSRSLGRAQHDMVSGARTIQAAPAFTAAVATTALAAVSLSVLFMGVPPR